MENRDLGSLLEYLSEISRVKLTASEAEEVKRRIEALKKLLDKLLEARVEGVEPLYHPYESQGILRGDTPGESLSREDALVNAAKTEDGFIVGPRTVEG